MKSSLIWATIYAIFALFWIHVGDGSKLSKLLLTFDGAMIGAYVVIAIHHRRNRA